MNRYISFGTAAAGFFAGKVMAPGEAAAARADIGEIVVEKATTEKPREGKVFAAIHAHLDDIPYYAAGTCAKLIAEGATGYIIRTTNDERCGRGSILKNIKSNEEEHFRMAKAVGFADTFDFYYRNHDMNAISSLELRARLILIFRIIKADIVVTFNPWGHGEENPDHWATGRAVEEACWMAGMGNDYPEHAEAGLKPHSVTERYYFVGRPGQPYNRAVDIGPHVEKKIDAIAECRSQGGGDSGSRLRARLAKDGKRLPLLGSDDRTADREYIRTFLLGDEERAGKKHGLKYAELFYYIDQRPAPGKTKVEEYVEKNAVGI